MRGSFRIARLGGIDVKVHYGWILVSLLVAWTLAEGVFPREFPSLDTAAYWVMGVVSSVLLLVSVVVHELAHSFVAESRGLKVRDITLFIFGGVSNILEEPRDAKDELRIAVVGPVASLVLAAVFWGISQGFDLPDPVDGVVGYLAGVNLILGLFNLIPGFPLDGGRVFRALVWSATHSLVTATRVAVGVGRGVSLLFVLAGLFLIVRSGAFVSGIWLIFIGWFLNNAAEANGQHAKVVERSGGITVRKLMRPDPRVVEPTANISDVVLSHLLESGQRAIPVVQDRRLTGMVTLKEIRDVPQGKWRETAVGEVMTPAEQVETANPEDSVATALDLMNAAETDVLPVVEMERLIGMVLRDDVARFIQVQHEMGVPTQDHEDHEDHRRAA